MHSCTLLGQFEDADLHEAGDGEVLWIGAKASLLHVLDEGVDPTLTLVANSADRNQPWYTKRFFGRTEHLDVEDSIMSLKLQEDFSVPDETRRVARSAFPKGCACLRIADALGCNDRERRKNPSI
jgi:hypothetical protein